MADINIQIKDLEGNDLFPKTKASVIVNSSGEYIEDIEKNAQENKIESIVVNGTPADVQNKVATITVETNNDVYSMVKQTTAESGYLSSYSLTKNGENVGDKINIPKDMVIQSGSVETVSQANTPYQGAQVGDLYLDLVLANTTNNHIYIPVNELVDVYTGGNGINISNNTVSINLDYLKQTFPTKQTTLSGYGITDAYTKSEVYSKSETYTKTEVDTKFNNLNYLTYSILE